MSNYLFTSFLESTILIIQIKSKECNLPYGITENVHPPSKCPALRNKNNPVVTLIDRKYYLGAYVISFDVENSSPLSSVPKLIRFARNLSRDHKALLELKMNCTVASCKLVDGLNFHEQKKIFDALKSYPFSIDECTLITIREFSAFL